MSQSLLTPFQSNVFRAMWIGMFISNIGTWMNEVGAAWLMASLPTSNLMVALLQSATTLPFFLLAYPAGTMADIFNRRSLLLVLHVWMFFMALVLTFCTYLNIINGWLLLLLIFGLGIGNAMMRPAWAASIPAMVPREELQNAVTLNSTSTNVTRAIGPALGGIIIFLYNPTAVFLLNAISFTVLIYVLYQWQYQVNVTHSTLPMERFYGAFKSGLRYTAHAPEIRALLIRSIVLFFFSSCIWSLLPVIAVRHLNTNANGYGAMMAAVGVGAILGATILPRLNQYLTRNHILLLASLVLTLSFIIMAISRDIFFLAITLAMFGAAWIWVFSIIVIAAQISLPDWVRARGLAIIMLTFGGSMAAGSALWGYLSDVFTIPVAINLAATGLFCLTLIVHNRYPVLQDKNHDLSPSLHWSAPELSIEPSLHDGPVMVTIEYIINGTQTEEFMRLMNEISRVRKRNGAYFWEVFNSVSETEHYIETYMVESWLEYLRHRERNTLRDQSIEEQLANLHNGEAKPSIKHFIAGKEQKPPSL